MTARNKNIPALRFKGFEGEWASKSGSDIFISSRKKGNEDLPIYSVTLDRGMVPRNCLDRSMLSDAKATDNLFVAKNDIAYNMMRMWQGAYGLSPENCMVSPAYIVLHPKTNMFPDFFIKYFGRSRSLYLFTAYSYGLTSDRLRLYFKDFALIKFNVPKLPEQQKIASFLSAIEEKIRQLTRRKELMEQYKKGVMQQLFSGRLRFKDDKGKAHPKWEEKLLSDIAERVTRKNKENNLNVLTISAQNGLVSQLEYFNKSVSAKDVTNYYLLFKDEFAYNKSYSTGYPMGAIKRLLRYDKGVVSTLYICFRFKGNVSLNFMEQYFENGYQNKEIEKVAQEGARNHGLLNIGVNDFLGIKIILPTIQEQQKIASFLSSIDNKIESVSKQIEGTKGYKKGLLQKMFV